MADDLEKEVLDAAIDWANRYSESVGCEAERQDRWVRKKRLFLALAKLQGIQPSSLYAILAPDDDPNLESEPLSETLAADDQPPEILASGSFREPPPKRKCHRDGCTSDVDFHFNWPGKGEGFVCAGHMPWLQSVVSSIGLYCPIQPIIAAAIVLFSLPLSPGEETTLSGEVDEGVQPGAYLCSLRMTPETRDCFQVCASSPDHLSLDPVPTKTHEDGKLRATVRVKNISNQTVRFMAQAVFER